MSEDRQDPSGSENEVEAEAEAETALPSLKVKPFRLKKLIVSSPNLFRNDAFRAHLYKVTHASAAEAAETVRHAFLGKPGQYQVYQKESIGGMWLRNKEDDGTSWTKIQCFHLGRSDVEIKAKLFLKEYSIEAATEALDIVFQITDCQYVDTLQIAPPVVALQDLGLTGLPKSDAEVSENSAPMVALWRKLSTLVQASKVRRMSLADVRAPTLQRVCSETNYVPSAYVLRENRLEYPKTRAMLDTLERFGVEVRSHGDNLVILADDRLERIGHIKPDWVLRYIVRVTHSMQLLDKRYAVGINVLGNVQMP